jgi:hypothetical protein
LIDQSAAAESMAQRPASFRVGLYEAIRRTAEAQRAAVVSDDLDRFYTLLQEREKLLEKAESVAQQLDGDDREHAQQVVRDILRLDQETEWLLTSKIDDVRVEMSDLNVGKQALSAYGRVVPLAADRRA